jgi:hypothetical protein
MFLLRFQEHITTEQAADDRPSAESMGRVRGATQTATKIHREKADPDLTAHSFSALRIAGAAGFKQPSSRTKDAVTAATKTLTEIRREAADRDPTPLSIAVVSI